MKTELGRHKAFIWEVVATLRAQGKHVIYRASHMPSSGTVHDNYILSVDYRNVKLLGKERQDMNGRPDTYVLATFEEDDDWKTIRKVNDMEFEVVSTFRKDLDGNVIWTLE